LGLGALGRDDVAVATRPGPPGGLRLRTPAPPDYVLLLAAAAILCVGLVMILSASSVTAAVINHDPYYYFKRQLLWALLGAAAFAFCARCDYRRWRSLAPLALAGTFLLLVAVLVLGHAAHGSTRWLGLGSAKFQPSELAKLSMVVYFSAWLSGRSARQVRSFWRCALPALVVIGAAAGLILLEPDLGTAAALAATALVLLYVVGVPLGQFAAIFGMAVPALGAAIFGSAYRRERFLAFLHPAAQAQQGGYHILQSLYALGSGGLFGVGLGLSRQKWFYLPEEHTDFIFAVLGEELGFLGGLLVLGLFGVLIWRGYRIAATAPDLFGTLLAAGLTTMLAVQVVVNIGVVSGVLPITGIPLPMISFGGSSLVFTLAGIGMLANISRHCRT
jgi:cell division protein FtsW